MSDTTSPKTYPAGVPCWVDSEQPDLDAAADFYSRLFGWTLTNAMPPGAPGSYLIATLEGADVAALAPSDRAEAGWNTYVAVDDADAAAARAVELGARVLDPPTDAGPAGRACALADPSGVELRLWQPRRRLGAQRVNAPGSWNFSDLHSDDTDAAVQFYGTLFGWEVDQLDVGDGAVARMWRRPGYGDHLAATSDPGIHERQAAVGAPPGFADAIAWVAALSPDELPHWHVTFSVDDRDDAVARAESLGATVISGPLDTMWNKSAVIRDPQGALLTVSEFTPPS